MRKSFLILPVLALAACEPAVPNSAAGVGFGDYQDYLAQREAQLQGAPKPAPVLASGTGYAGSTATASSAPVAPAATGYGAPLSATNLSTAPVAPAALPATPAPVGDGSIGSEAMAALRATAPGGAAPAPVSAAPTAPMVSSAPAAPVVSGSAGPNLAAYALSATNAPGQAAWPRGGLKLTNSDKACAKYVSPDLAQMAFLERGGPQRDPGNLDPDGDGFACGWDPRPFQAARQ